MNYRPIVPFQDMINYLNEEKRKLQEEITQLRVIQDQDMKRMEEKLENLLNSYGERSRYAHSWKK